MNCYRKEIRGAEIDVYDILRAYNIADPALAHAIKKLLCAGQRNGGKSARQDVEEALQSIENWIKNDSREN